MFLISFLISLSFSKPNKLILQDFLLGEWNLVESKQNSLTQSTPAYTAEFHKNSQGSIDGSIWSDTISEIGELPDFDQFEIAQIQIHFLSELHGSIFNLKKEKEVLSEFIFHPINMGKSLMTHLTINKTFSIQISLQNSTYFQIFLTDNKNGISSELYALRATPTKITKQQTYYKYLLIGAAVLVSLQAISWSILKICKRSIDKKIEEERENTVIDLDKYCELLSEKAKSKDKTD